MRRSVLYYTDSTLFGGAEQVLLSLLGGLDLTCWRPVLACPVSPGPVPLIEGARRLGVPVVSASPMPDGWAGLRKLPAFVATVRSVRPAIFHANLTWPLACRYGLLGAILANVPATIATVHLHVDISYGRMTLAKQRALFSAVDRFIAVSRELARRLRAVFGIPGRKISVVRNGIPAEAFDHPPNDLLRTGLGANGRAVALTVARLDAQKGHRYLLEAANLLPDVLFVFAGDGPERTGLEELAGRLGVTERVVFLGERRDIADLLAGCDLFVLPSLFEGLPLSVLEAMSAGRPVVASAVGGTPEVITDGRTGLLVPPRDPVALASAIRRVVGDRAGAQHMALAGRALVAEEFSTRAMVARTCRVYNQLLASRRPR